MSKSQSMTVVSRKTGDGTWECSATVTLPDGKKVEFRRSGFIDERDGAQAILEEINQVADKLGFIMEVHKTGIQRFHNEKLIDEEKFFEPVLLASQQICDDKSCKSCMVH